MYEWSNEMGSRSRSAWLLFVQGDVVIPFNGKDIPDVAVIRGTDYKKNGKWSHTTYRLELAPSVRAIAGHSGWETGRFVEGLASAVKSCGKTPDTWAEVANLIGVSVPSAMDFLRAWKPKAAAKLDEVEQALAGLEEATGQTEDSLIVMVSFGNPTNRQMAEGWWEAPKAIPGYNAELRLKDQSEGWLSETNIEVVGITGTALSVKFSAGMHGGYYAVSVALVPGTETEFPPFHQEGVVSAPAEEPIAVSDPDPIRTAPDEEVGMGIMADAFFKAAGLGQ